MKTVELKFTDKQVREYDYFLGKKFGKRKFENKIKLAIMEAVSSQARKEAEEAEAKIK